MSPATAYCAKLAASSAAWSGPKICRPALAAINFVSSCPVATRKPPAPYRSAGVINFTKFTIKDDGEPAQVNLQNRCATLPAGDSAESLIARTRTEIAKG